MRLVRLPAALVGFIISVAGVVAFAAPAVAVVQPTMVIRSGATSSAEFGPMVGNLPTSGVADPEPSDCEDPATFCDDIPIEVVLPADRDEADEYFIQLEISWDDPAGANDVDTFVYDDKQIAKTSYSAVGSGATGDNPEQPKFLVGTLRRWHLVVLNYTGPNVGYTIRGKLVESKFERPFESLAPGFSGGGTRPSTPRDETIRPIDRSADPAPLPAFAPMREDGSLSTSPPTTSLADIAISPDADFEAFPSSGFDNAITAPPRLSATGVPAATAAAPVSGAVLVFWLVVVPVLLLAAGAVVVLRRRPSLGFA